MIVAVKPQWFETESADAYHALSGAYLSSHLLRDFRWCPLLYWLRRQGVLPEKDRAAYTLGSAAHMMILEGQERFAEEFEIGGPVNPRTGAPFGPSSKAFREWVEQHGKPILSEDQYELVCRMDEAVAAHDLASDLLSEGQPELVVRTEYVGRRCQIRMDWFDPHRGIVDLKTCDDLTWFESDARRFGYLHQMAFYRAVLAQRLGILMPVHFIAVEKKMPHRCGVWRAGEDSLAVCQKENEAAIRRLLRCEATGDWPTGYEEPRVLDLI